MRPLRPSFCVLLLVGPWLGDCDSSPATGATEDGGPGSDAATSTDAGAPTDDVGSQPDTTSCTGDAGACLSGTAKADQFVLMPTELKASLYRVFPSSNPPQAIQEQVVAKDSTWAFSGLATWAHYYVVFVPGFTVGVAKTVATRVGPLAVPRASAASIDVLVKPAQLDVLENSVTGGPLQVQAASARLFDPATGDEIGSGGTVSISIGTASTPMPWTPSAPSCATPPCGAYEVAFPTPPPAQPSYHIVSSLTSGAAPTTWNLVADPPQFAGAIASPAPGATIPAGKALTVTWPSSGAADYEIVDLFQRKLATDGGQGSWSRVYTSPAPVAPDQSSETIPAAMIAPPGMYLLGVSFTKANCPTTADGCVEASTEASELLTVQ